MCIHDAPEPKCPLPFCPQELPTLFGWELAPRGAALGPAESPFREAKFLFSPVGEHGRRVLKRQSVQEKFVDYCWRWHQIFQFQVENALQPLRAKRAQFRELPQEFGQIVGAVEPPVIKSHMVFETIYNLVLKFFHPLGFFQPVPLCKRERCGTLRVGAGGKGSPQWGWGGDTDLSPWPGQRCKRRPRCRCSCFASWRKIPQWNRSTPQSRGRTAAGAGPPRCRR